MMHKKRCHNESGTEPRELPPSVKIGAETLIGAGVGIGAVVLGLSAISLVGGVALFHGALLKLGAGAGLAGGGIGFLKGVAQTRVEGDSDHQLHDSTGETPTLAGFQAHIGNGKSAVFKSNFGQ